MSPVVFYRETHDDLYVQSYHHANGMVSFVNHYRLKSIETEYWQDYNDDCNYTKYYNGTWAYCKNNEKFFWPDNSAWNTNETVVQEERYTANRKYVRWTNGTVIEYP